MTNKYTEYQNLEKKAWRAIQYDWDTLVTAIGGGKLYCLTDFQATWLQANVEYLRWQTRQVNCPCTPEELATLADELELALMSCVDFQPYQLDYVYNNQVQQKVNELQTLWQGNPSDLNPNSPDDNFNGNNSTDRNNALCNACKIFVYSYSQNWVRTAQTVLGVTFVIGLLASITLIGGMVATVLVGGLAFITSTALDAMQDEDALDDVVCCMYNALLNQAISQTTFEQSLDACGFLPGSNQAIIRDIISSDLVQFPNYLSFLEQLGLQFVLAEAGVVDCPCDPSPMWTQNFDFTIDDQGFVPSTVSAITRAVYHPGDGWGVGAAANQIVFMIQCPAVANIEVTEIEIEVTEAGTLNVQRYTSPSSFLDTVVSSPITIETIRTINLAYNVLGGQYWALNYTAGDGNMNAATRVTRVTLSGMGTNPF